MTPVKECNESPGIGATPLNSSSLEKYMDGGVPDGPPQHVVVPGAHTQNNAESSGIMNFIFQRNNGITTGGSVGMKRPEDFWNNCNGGGGGGGGNIRLTNSHYGSSSSTVGGGLGVPPTIVQLPQVPPYMQQTDAPPSDRERGETKIIKFLIDSYFSIVRKNYIDMVPKMIMYFLVNHVKDELQDELVGELYRESEVGFLMKEAKGIAMRRRTCLKMRDLLQKALEIVNEVRDFNTFTNRCSNRSYVMVKARLCSGGDESQNCFALGGDKQFIAAYTKMMTNGDNYDLRWRTHGQGESMPIHVNRLDCIVLSRVPIYPASYGHAYQTLIWRMGIELESLKIINDDIEERR